MNTTLLYLYVLYLVTLADSSPQVTKLQFRNLYKNTINKVPKKPSPHIIGGQEAEPHSIPFQVFLEVYSEDKGWYCGGSLISQNYVLTAAHCNEDGIEAHITLGAHSPLQSENTQVKLVSKNLTIHEEYDSETVINDIGVIQLPKSVNLNEAVQMVSLPSKNDVSNDYAGTTARISGWGLTDGFNSQLSEVLNYVDVEVITNEECEEGFGKLPQSNICTSEKEEKGSCSGDSGGPLISEDGKQIGIVSFGIIFCLPGYPSGFSRVTSFLDWIETNTDVKIS